jgi:catechol 2,3-dioxygenase-like lactoylglutathione lyase family enzyme
LADSDTGEEAAMSTAQVPSEDAAPEARGRRADFKLEVAVIPVADVKRSKQFYEGLGWRLDADIVVGDAFRIVQFTPPGSGCSVSFGKGVTAAAAGSATLELIVSDIVVARDELAGHGIDVSDVFHGSPFNPTGRISGPDPERKSYMSYAVFEDPDRNVWLLQEITARRPGRIDANETTFASAADLADAMRRASAAHGEHEQRTGQADENWPDWYAAYVVAEQHGRDLPT